METMTHITLLALRRAESARACRRCGRPIVLSDGFGLSEGICTRCIRGGVRPRRSIVAGLRRAA